MPSARVVAVAPVSRPVRLAWEQALLPGRLRRIGPDVHHGPHYTFPEHTRVPAAVTVHDLSFFEDPGWHERSKVRFFRRAIRVAARRAGVVVCPSAVTAGELARWCTVDAPVVVAHHGVDTGRFRPGERSTGADAALLRAVDPRLAPAAAGAGAAVPFVLFVGTLEPPKGRSHAGAGVRQGGGSPPRGVAGAGRW